VKVALSVDMEGLAQLTDPHEILSARPEYWADGKPAMEAETVAACEGLIAAGASEVIVLDNHGSGNPLNISPGCLPRGARLESWDVFDLPAHGAMAMLQIGYHARGGSSGFISHTYVPGLRLRIGGELISESHGRAWAAGVPLIGIAGNDTHEQTLGSLAGVPFLTVQRSQGRRHAERAFPNEADSLDAVRRFAAACLREIDHAPRPAAPTPSLFEASMPNGDEQEDPMSAAGWQRRGDVEYAIELHEWSEARAPLAAAMTAAMAPLMSHWVGATSPEERSGLDSDRVAGLTQVFDEWCSSSFPEWFTLPATEIEGRRDRAQTR
jgi:D-amino peptidase